LSLLAGLVRRAARRGGNLGILAWQRHVLRRRFFEKRIYDYRLLLDADDPGISRQLIRLGERELEQKFLLERELRPGMHAFDLGGNIGYYTVMMGRLVGPNGRVHAVEPVPENFDLLKRNVARNGLAERTELQQIAIAADDGARALLLSHKSNWHSFHAPSVDPAVPWKRRYARATVGSIAVKTRALAGYLAERPAVDLLRMDLEGFEVEILQAVLRLPAAVSPNLRILFETHPEFYDSRGNDLRPVLRALCRTGYTVKYLISDFHLREGRALFERHGYGAAHMIREGRARAIYTGLAANDAIELICASECVHAAFLARTGCG
jgi:FkbM family methyltransferase